MIFSVAGATAKAQLDGMYRPVSQLRSKRIEVCLREEISIKHNSQIYILEFS